MERGALSLQRDALSREARYIATLLRRYVYYVGELTKGRSVPRSLPATLLCNDKFHVYYITLAHYIIVYVRYIM